MYEAKASREIIGWAQEWVGGHELPKKKMVIISGSERVTGHKPLRKERKKTKCLKGCQVV